MRDCSATFELLTPIAKDSQVNIISIVKIIGSAILICNEGARANDNKIKIVATNPNDHPPPTVIIYVQCQSFGSLLAPFFPAMKGIIINDTGIPIGKKIRKIRPKVMVLNALYRAS